jgi:hypothetical protein
MKRLFMVYPPPIYAVTSPLSVVSTCHSIQELWARKLDQMSNIVRENSLRKHQQKAEGRVSSVYFYSQGSHGVQLGDKSFGFSPM